MSDLVARAGDALVDAGLSLAVAESCTGGLLAARLTDPPGASRYFAAGLVTYANDAKERLLGVDPATLAAYGAVSEPVAREMAEGARRVTRAGAAIAITGVAGPGGGTEAKPVGTVWIAAAAADRWVVRSFQFDGDRGAVRELSVRAALELLLDALRQASGDG